MTHRLDGGRAALIVFTVLSLVLSLFALTAPPAQADHINPTGPVGSNCVEFQAGETGTKSPADYPGVSITLESWDATPDDPHEVTFTVAGVVGWQQVDVSVKSGTNVQEDGPYFNGTHSILTGEKNAISHVRMCVFVGKYGKIVVKKEVTEGSDTTVFFDFEADYQADGFSLSDGQNYEEDVTVGVYSVDEIVPEGWELQSATCTSTDEQDASTPDAIDVSEGEIVTCTFVNHEIQPEPGRIIVKKQVTEGSDTAHSFQFTASYDGDGFALSDGQSNDSGDLEAGTYSVSETVPAGWSLQSATCDDQSDPSEISLQEGETVTCTFVNHELPPEPGRIIVEKVVTEGSDTAQSFQFTASYDGDGFALSDGQSNDSGDLAPGTYSVSETVPEGWTLESATCDDESDPSEISLQEGETVTCTFVNHELPPEAGRIIVEKTVLIGDTAQSFDFTASYDDDGFALSDGQSNDSGDLAPGTYSVSETLPASGDWTLESATCDNGDDPSAITLDEGEVVTCTFTNSQSEVLASVLVTVGGSCSVDNDGDGVGTVSVEMSVPGGATVVIKSGATTVATFTDDGSVTVPVGQTYTWEATPNEGFEFPAGFVASGTVAIEDCSDDELPFTGVDTERLLGIAILLLGSGALMVFSTRRREEG